MSYADRPNIFILTADSLRADAFAKRMGSLPSLTEGVTFTNAVATASATAHSIPALAAGVYADTSGYGLGESDNITTGAEQLTSAGYNCGLWSDNHLFGSEQNYDRGFSGGQTGEPSWKKRSQWIFERMNSELAFNFGRWMYFHAIKPAQDLISESMYYTSAHSLHGSTLDWLDENADEPSMCWIHYMDTHHPFDPPSTYLDEYSFNTERSRSELAELSSKAIITNKGKGITDADLEDIKLAYEASCDYWCDEVTAFIRKLRERGHFVPGRDILVLTADHGEGFSPEQHDMLGHTPTPSFWEDLIRVPLIFSHPDWESSRVDGQVSLIDIMPTLLKGVGVEVPETFEGTAASTPSDLVVETAYLTAIGPERIYHGARHNSGWKLFADRISDSTAVEFVSDRSGDMDRVLLTKYGTETEEIVYSREAGTNSLPSDKVAREKWQELYELIRTHRGGLFTEEAQEMSEDLQERLHDLGYIDDIPGES